MEEKTVISVKKPAGDHIAADHKNEKKEKQNPDNKSINFFQNGINIQAASFSMASWSTKPVWYATPVWPYRVVACAWKGFVLIFSPEDPNNLIGIRNYYVYI